MGSNGNGPIPFQSPNGVAIVGQPFSVSDVCLPLNGIFICNCAVASGGAPTRIPFVASAPITCPTCGQVKVVRLPVPAGAQIQVLSLVQDSEKQVPS